MSVPLGTINQFFGCCGSETGSPVGSIAPYVVSLNGLSGILTINGQGAIVVSQLGGVIYLSLAAAAGLGTVTSVGISSNSAALVVGSTPVTTAGTITLALDASLTGIAALGWVADTFAYGTGVDTFALTALTSYARTLLDDANAATARATLGGTTAGQAFYTLANPGAVTFPRIDAANTVTARSAANFKIDLALVIGTNIQAWSADLDSFVTNASWSGIDLTLTGAIIVSGVTSSQPILVNVPATTGAQALALAQDSDLVMEVLDTGQTTITAVTGFLGNVFTITSIDAGDLMVMTIGGDVEFNGSVTASGFDGSGSGLTNLDASQLVSGTVANARLDADLAALAVIGPGILTNTGAGTASARTITGSSFITVTNGNGVSGNPTISITSTVGVAGSVVLSVSAPLLTPIITAPSFDKTITGAGTTGAQTINKTAGTVRFAAAATSLVVTCSLCNASSIILCAIQTNDATAVLKGAVPTIGTFTIYMDTAPTGETAVGFFVVN